MNILISTYIDNITFKIIIKFMSLTSPQVDIPAQIDMLQKALDQAWITNAGFMVLLMQLGFAFLEAGCVRYKNLQSIMIKVFLNTCICVIAWWLVGFGFAFG